MTFKLAPNTTNMYKTELYVCKLSLKSILLQLTDPSVAQAMSSKLVDNFVFLLEKFFFYAWFLDFVIIIFLSQWPSALRESGRDLIFTPNISMSEGGVHRHKAILRKTMGASTSHPEQRHFTTATPFHACSMPRFGIHGLHMLSRCHFPS